MRMLYHYTSLNGVIGIVKSRSLWATQVSYLNDASEFLHGLTFAKQIASDIFMEDDYLEAFGWAVRHALESISNHDIYVTSFSVKPDLLSQWRGYCPEGSGICLGFDFEKIRSFCIDQDYRLGKCIYEHQEQTQQIESLIVRCLDKFPKPPLSREEYDKLTSKDQVRFVIDYRLRTSEGSDKLKADDALKWLCIKLTELIPLFKHEGFHEESEWRIVAKAPNEQVMFRARPSSLAPYVELEILPIKASSVLREVIIGPSPNQSRCETSVDMLLAVHGLNMVKLGCSSLPFNSW